MWQLYGCKWCNILVISDFKDVLGIYFCAVVLDIGTKKPYNSACYKAKVIPAELETTRRYPYYTLPTHHF